MIHIYSHRVIYNASKPYVYQSNRNNSLPKLNINPSINLKSANSRSKSIEK